MMTTDTINNDITLMGLPEGPKISFDPKRSILIIEDLNPQMKLEWLIERKHLALMCIKLFTVLELLRFADGANK